MTHHPLVDAIGEQQHLDALGAQLLEIRTAAGRGHRVGDEVVDAVLPGLHAGDVLGERRLRFVRLLVRARETQQRQDLVAVRGVLARTFLQHRSEFLPERGVLLGLILGEPREEIQRALRERSAHRLDLGVLLQQLARDIERQVVGVEHAAHEAQVERQELLGVVHDEHASHIELEAPRGVALVEVEGRAPGDVEQRGVLALALDLVVAPGERVGEVVRDMPVEFFVFVVRDLAARPRPQRLTLVGGLPVEAGLALLAHQHREGDVVRIAAHQRAQPPTVGELLGVVLEVQHHHRAALLARRGLDGEVAVGLRGPADTRGGRLARLAGEHLDLVGDDERRIEADAELADELRVLLLIAREPLEELPGARLGDGAEVGDGLLARHADAVVADGERALGRVVVHPDLELGLAGHQVRLGERQETQLVVGVRGVRDEFAQEDLAVAVERVDHELQELTHLGLEAVLFCAVRGGGGAVASAGRVGRRGRRFGHVRAPREARTQGPLQHGAKACGFKGVSSPRARIRAQAPRDRCGRSVRVPTAASGSRPGPSCDAPDGCGLRAG